MKPELGQCVKASRFRPQSLTSTCYFYLQPTKSHLCPHELGALGERGLQQRRAQSDTQSANIHINRDTRALWSAQLCNQEFLRCSGVCCFCSWKDERCLFISVLLEHRPSCVLSASRRGSTKTFVKWCCLFSFHLFFCTKYAGSVQTEHLSEAQLL